MCVIWPQGVGHVSYGGKRYVIWVILRQKVGHLGHIEAGGRSCTCVIWPQGVIHVCHRKADGRLFGSN